jgi:hypothetical protein
MISKGSYCLNCDCRTMLTFYVLVAETPKQSFRSGFSVMTVINGEDYLQMCPSRLPVNVGHVI